MHKTYKKIALAKLEARSVKNGCWVWQGANTRGYGRVSFVGRAWGAHRLSWEIHHGPIPPWMMVCHHCDNPGCWNPDHLFLGTAADNVRDSRSKGCGVGNSTSIMNMQKADAIRRMWNKGGLDKHQIAIHMNLTWGQVHGVISGKYWQL